MATGDKVIKVLMVCLGNICRSPTAHGVFQSHVCATGLEDSIEVDSAGTADYHIGSKPDERSMSTALRNGYDLSEQRARQVCQQDFEYYDYVLAMDRQNLADLRAQCPSIYKKKLFLFLDFGSSTVKEVPDPYYGGDKGFDAVLDLVEDAAKGLMAHIREQDLE